MLRTIISGATALTLTFGVALPATAGNGVLDFLDPCVEARDSFRDQRQTILAKADAGIEDAEAADATQEYRDAWYKAKKEQARPYFDSTVAPTLRSYGVTDMDGAFETWFGDQLAQISAEDLNELIDEHFRQELKAFLVEQRANTAEELERQKNELHDACKITVGDQVLRGTITAVMAPVNLLQRNWEIAGRESGAIAQGIAASTGISIDAINENGGVFGGGLSGGENSFFRKNLGIRF